MNNIKPQDSKREDFRKYLERTGTMDVITKIFVNLYEEPEKPADALAYMYKALADDRPDKSSTISDERAKIQSLEMELTEAKARIQELEQLLAGKKDLERVEPAPSSNPSNPPDSEQVPTAQEMEEAAATTPGETSS